MKKVFYLCFSALLLSAGSLYAVNNYAIEGFFGYAYNTDYVNTAYDCYTNIGAYTHIMWGGALKKSDEAYLKTGSTFSNAVMMSDGQHIIDRLRSRIKYARAANEFSDFYYLSTAWNFGNSKFSIYDSDVQTNGNNIYYGYIFHADTPSDPLNTWTDFNTGGTNYVLLLVKGTKECYIKTDLEAAEARNMNVFIGHPIAMAKTNLTYMIETNALPVLYEYLKIFADKMNSLYGGYSSFSGFYDTFEIGIMSNQNQWVEDIHYYYADAANILQDRTGKPTLISPYHNAKKWNATSYDDSAEKLKYGFKLLAERVAGSGVEFIAPQNGRGVGTHGLYFDAEKNQLLPSDVTADTNVMPASCQTYDEGYTAPMHEYFKAYRDVITDLTAQGIEMHLWDNIEAFRTRPVDGEESFTSANRARTFKDELDKELRHGAGYVEKIICYQWDAFFTDPGDEQTTLYQDVITDYNRPVPVYGTKNSTSMDLYGFNLTGSSYITISWKDINNNPLSATKQIATVPGSWIDATYGQTHTNKPYHLRRIYLKWVPPSLKQNDYISISVSNAVGGENYYDWKLY